MSLWVVDTSPLVFLGHLDRLELLRHPGREVCRPQAVADEIAAKADTATQAVEAACATWMQVRQVTDHTAVTFVQAVLHTGEAEAIVLATELHAERLVLDDQEARRFAQRCGLAIIGTLGILLAAKQRGALTSLREELNALAALGFHAHPQLVAAVLQHAGE